MINSKNYTIFLIPYFTICCSLYQMTYWAFFGLNGLSLISIQDIIKSSVQPLILTSASTIIGLYIAHKTHKKIIEPKIKSTTKRNILPLILFFIFCVTGVAFLYHLIPNQRYYIVAFLLTNIVYTIIDIDKIFDKSFNTYFDKSFLFMSMLYFPAFSISTAAQEAETILNNKSYKYSINVRTIVANNTLVQDTIKFIGSTDKNFIFTDLKNSKIIFIKNDSLTLWTK